MPARLTIDKIKKIALSREIICLSNEYKNNSIKLNWQCKINPSHKWSATTSSFMNSKRGCPYCGGNVRLSIDFIKRKAEERGVKCLSEEYKNIKTNIRFLCDKNHEWEATSDSFLLSKKGCPICAKNKKLTIEDMRRLAESNKGECLSDVYVDSKTKLWWKCDKGHIWDTAPSNIISGTWCRECNKPKKYTIEDMKEIAGLRGGLCLSNAYKDAHTKLQWQCSKGHIWPARPADIIHQNQWCRRCGSTEPLTIELMHQIAKERGGKCLSTMYKGAHTKLEWECKEGHKWPAKPNDVKNNNNWCPECSGNTKLTIEYMYDLAAKKRGKCLSDKYINNHTRLEWQCENGHTFFRKPNTIINGHWCQYCQWYVNEEKCRFILEYLLQTPFPKDRNILNKKELDGYSEKLNIAFEYQGKQHYEKVLSFKDTDETVEERKKTDQYKKEQCEKKGIKLLIIPYTCAVDNETLVSFLIENLNRYNVELKKIATAIPFKDFHMSKSRLAELRELAIAKGGECLSEIYINNRQPMRWRCELGHEWSSTSDNIKSGRWCPECAKRSRVEKRKAFREAKLMG